MFGRDPACGCDLLGGLLAAVQGINVDPCPVHHPDAVVELEAQRDADAARAEAEPIAAALTEVRADDDAAIVNIIDARQRKARQTWLDALEPDARYFAEITGANPPHTGPAGSITPLGSPTSSFTALAGFTPDDAA